MGKLKKIAVQIPYVIKEVAYEVMPSVENSPDHTLGRYLTWQHCIRSNRDLSLLQILRSQ